MTFRSAAPGVTLRLWAENPEVARPDGIANLQVARVRRPRLVVAVEARILGPNWLDPLLERGPEQRECPEWRELAGQFG